MYNFIKEIIQKIILDNINIKFSTVKNAAYNTGIFLQRIFFQDVKIWKIVLVLFSIFLITFLYYKHKKKIKKNNRLSIIKKEEQKILEFSSGKYKDVNFKWDVIKTADNKIVIRNLRPVCNCGGELILKSNVKTGNFIRLAPIPYCVNCEKPLAININGDLRYEAEVYFSNILSKKIENYNNIIKNAKKTT